MRPAELVQGNCYFSVGYHDRDLLLPFIQTLTYIGTEEDPVDGRRLWLFREPRLVLAADGAEAPEDDAVIAAFPDAQLHGLVDLAGLMKILNELSVEHPLHPVPPQPGAASVSELEGMRAQVLRFLEEPEQESITITISFTDDAVSLARRDVGSVELLLFPHPRLDADRDSQLRSACRDAGLSATQDYLANRGRTRVLAYPLSSLDIASLQRLLTRIFLDVYEMRKGDTLTCRITPRASAPGPTGA